MTKPTAERPLTGTSSPHALGQDGCRCEQTPREGLLADFAGSWVFYSRLPPLPLLQTGFRRIPRFAPVIGLVIACIQGLLWQVAMVLQLPVASGVCLLLAAEIGLTGALHLDGTMDTADGLSAGQRCLAAMADSRVGAMAVATLAALLLLRVAGLLWLAELGGSMGGVLAATATWARIAPLFALAWFQPLRKDGSSAHHARQQRGLTLELLPGALLCGGLSVYCGPWVLAGALPAVLVPTLLSRQLGGHCGDSLGASVEWTATACVWIYPLLQSLGAATA